MTFRSADFSFKKSLQTIDWKLLLFLILFLDVKLIVKAAALVLIYLLRFDFRFGFSFKNSRLPLFYPLIIAIAFVPFIVNRNYAATNYLSVFLMGILFWGACLLAVHQVKLSVEHNTIAVIERTILAFFIINALLSFFNIAYIMWETGTLNPYVYQGENQKYFIGTGDYIRGISFDTSSTNAVMNAFGVIYFLYKKMPAMVLVCMAVLLLTASNFTNLILLLILLGLFVVKSTRDQKSLIAICVMLMVVFMAKISPQNDKYVFGALHNLAAQPVKQTATLDAGQFAPKEDAKRVYAQEYIDSISAVTAIAHGLSATPQKPPKMLPNYHGRILIVGPNINKPPYIAPTDTTPEQQRLIAFIGGHKGELTVSKQPFKEGPPGKMLALLQTAKFLLSHPFKLIAGDGIGNFSSKAAFKATGLDVSGKYPARYVYISKDFLSNHLDIYLDFFSRRGGLRSLTNTPYSVYDQLLSEYGMLGVLAFLIFYAGYFFRHNKKLTYGLPLLILMIPVFGIDYWFEQLSIIVIFELLLLLDIKKAAPLELVTHGHK